MSQIRVVITDDHPLTREGLRNLLEKEPDIEVVAETDTGEETLSLIETVRPDVLVLDMELPDLNGVEVARQVQANYAEVHILALSAHTDDHYIRGLLAAGAAGYLLKEEATAEIIEAVRGVAGGQKGWLSRKVAARLSDWSGDPPPLTEREMEALKLVVAGKTNQEIGQALGISEKTVEKHLDGVFTKLNVSSRVEAAVYAVRTGLG